MLTFSVKDGSVRLGEGVCLKPGMAYDVVNAIKNKLSNTPDGADSSLSALFPGIEGIGGKLIPIAHYKDKKLNMIEFYVPRSCNGKVRSRQQQAQILEQCLGEEFMNAALSGIDRFVFPWGKVDFAWDDRCYQTIMTFIYAI